MVPIGLHDDIGHVVDNVTALVKRRTGRLTSVQVAVPRDYDSLRVRESIAEGLALLGLDQVDLVVEPGEGPMRVVAATFEAMPRNGTSHPGKPGSR